MAKKEFENNLNVRYVNKPSKDIGVLLRLTLYFIIICIAILAYIAKNS